MARKSANYWEIGAFRAEARTVHKKSASKKRAKIRGLNLSSYIGLIKICLVRKSKATMLADTVSNSLK